MPDAPLSRRARRAMEAQAAERAAAHGDPTQSFADATASGDTAAVNTGEVHVSRRDRRRLERLARPMESWTAEEEMIATGQIPAMTPERIAEQERLAAEAAEKAAADAHTASAELRALAQRDLERGRSAEPATPPARVPTADTPVVQPAPTNDPQAPLEERAIVEPYSPRFELDDEGLPHVGDASRPVAIPTGYEPDAKIERTPAPSSAPEPAGASEQPVTWPEDFDSILAPASDQEAQAGATPPVEQEPAAVTEDSSATAEAVEQPHSAYAWSDAEAAAARAKVFEELFPPGSSQAALLEQDRQAREAAAAQPDVAAPPPQAAAPASIDDDEEERQRGIEEIRRLTQAAISGIEKKSRPEAQAPEPDGFNRYEMPAEPEGGHGFTVAGEAPPHPAWEQPQASPFPTPGSLAPPSGETPTSDAYQQSGPPGPHTPSGGLAPHHATFDEALRTPSTEIPVRPMSQPDPNQGQVSSPWGSHPLDAAQTSTPREVDDFQPVSDAPRPDFSQLYNRPAQSGQFPTTSGQFPTTSGQFPTTSGQFPVAPPVTGQIRRAPDLPPVGGAKHFKWLHLAVIGALMFLLGVVIYNVAWGQ